MSYTVTCNASPKVIENLLRKFTRDLIGNIPTGSSKYTSAEFETLANAFLDRKFAKKILQKKTPSKPKEKSPTKSRLTQTHTVFRLRNSNGEDVKGVNNAFLRVAVDKKTRKIHKVNPDNWNAAGNTAFKNNFPTDCIWPEGSRQPTAKSPVQIGKVTPKKKATTPKKKATTPKKKATTPKKKATTPKKKATTPKKKETTPKKKETTPKKKETTPNKKATTPKKKVTAMEKRKLDLLTELTSIAKKITNSPGNIGMCSFSFSQQQKDIFIKKKKTIKEIRELISVAKKRLRAKESAYKRVQKKAAEVKKLVDAIKVYDNSFDDVHPEFLPLADTEPVDYDYDTIDKVIKGLKTTLAKHKREERKATTKAKKKTHEDLIQELLSGSVGM